LHFPLNERGEIFSLSSAEASIKGLYFRSDIITSYFSLINYHKCGSASMEQRENERNFALWRKILNEEFLLFIVAEYA
jgi:hypothetical protein